MVPHLSLTVDLSTEATLRAGAASVVARVRPAWRQEDIRWRIYTDGITNKLVGARGEGGEAVLVRVYGEGTDRIIDRQEEMRNMVRLQGIGCGSKLYASFDNGICYEFLEGEVLGQARLGEEGVWRGVATRLAAMHLLPLEEGKDGPCLWARIRQFIACCEPSCRPRLAQEFPSKQELEQEAATLEQELSSSGDSVVFCHNDLLLANVVLRPGGEVSFIDLEYGAANYAAFDIANHFVEFVGCEGELDYPRWLPSRDRQLAWLKEYLGRREGREAGELEVEQLQQRVEQFMPCAHLLWAVWAVIQAESSSIDFDFEDYAVQRWREFRRWRGLLASRKS